MKSEQENSDQVIKNYENSITGGFSVRSTLKNLVIWSLDHLVTYKRSAFTMAEILLSLTIIGVVAAITLPSLTGNINERTWNTQRKALYSRMSQAVSLMPSVNGYGVYKNEEKDDAGNVTQTAEDTAAETFLSAGLSKVLKINNICDAEHIADCGLPAQIVTLNSGSKIDFPVTAQELNSDWVGQVVDNGYGYGYDVKNFKAAAFETANGESVAVFYNRNCRGSLSEVAVFENSKMGFYYMHPMICVNFIFDLNGKKGPNTVNKDIGFMSLVYSSDSVLNMPIVAPKMLTSTLTGSSVALISQGKRLCTNYGDDYRIPRLDEVMSMFINRNLITSEKPSLLTSSTQVGWVNGVLISMPVFASLTGVVDDSKSNANVWCVKR